MPTSAEGHVRLESVPLMLRDLTHSQWEALQTVMRILQQGVSALPPLSKDPASAPAFDCGLELTRTARVALLSGERGTGKTSLLLTLMFLTKQACALRAKRFLDGGPDPAIGQRQKTLWEQLQVLNKPNPRLVWLDTLDMEPLADATSLLASVMVRLEALLHPVAEPSDCAPGQYIQPPALPQDDALGRLRHLLHETVFAWDGVVDPARSKQEPPEYVESVIRAERKRMKLGQRLGTVLDQIACHLQRTGQCENPLFVLPVDDIDLNPERAPSVLRLLRMITTPRLFTIVAGHDEYLRVVFQVERLGRLNQLGSCSSALDDKLSAAVNGLISDTTVNALRKLIPPAQRAHIDYPDVEEALSYPPATDGAEGNTSSPRTLLELLERTPLVGDEPAVSVCGQRLSCLADLFTTKEARKSWKSRQGQESLRLLPYEANRVFQAPMRKVADLWHLLRRQWIELGEEPKRARLRLRHLIADAYLSEVHEDPLLTETLRQQAINTVLPQVDGGVLLDTNPYRVDGVSAARGMLPAWDGSNSVYIRFVVPGSQRITLTHGAASASGGDTVLSSSTSAWLMLLHDAVQIADLGGLLGMSLARLQPKEPPVSWSGLGWPLPTFLRLYERDRFTAFVDQASRFEFDHPTKMSTERLALTWIAAHPDCELLSTFGDRLGDISLTELREHVFDALDNMAKNPTGRQNEILLNAALLLAPECGVGVEDEKHEVHDWFAPWLNEIPRFTGLADVLRSRKQLTRWWMVHAAEINPCRAQRRDSVEGSRTNLRLFCVTPQTPNTAGESLDRLAGQLVRGNQVIFSRDNTPQFLKPETCPLTRAWLKLREPWIRPEDIDDLLRHIGDCQAKIDEVEQTLRQGKPVHPDLETDHQKEALHWLVECRNKLGAPDESNRLTVALWLHPINRILSGMIDLRD